VGAYLDGAFIKFSSNGQ